MRNLLAAALLALSAGPAFAGAFDGFQLLADSGSMKPFTRDLGGVLGSATFHSGRSLGFSGFDLGIRGGAMFSPDPNNRILRGHGVKSFGLPWVQADIGMPFKIDGFIRAVSFQGLAVAGGGLRYGLFKTSDAPWATQLLVSGAAHSVVHQHFSGTHLGANLVASWGIPVFTPYVAAGLDRTRVVVRSSLADPSINGTSFQTLESRFTAGMSFRPWPFFYVNAAGILVHGRRGAEAGIGLHF